MPHRAERGAGCGSDQAALGGDEHGRVAAVAAILSRGTERHPGALPVEPVRRRTVCTQVSAPSDGSQDMEGRGGDEAAGLLGDGGPPRRHHHRLAWSGRGLAGWGEGREVICEGLMIPSVA